MFTFSMREWLWYKYTCFQFPRLCCQKYTEMFKEMGYEPVQQVALIWAVVPQLQPRICNLRIEVLFPGILRLIQECNLKHLERLVFTIILFPELSVGILGLKIFFACFVFRLLCVMNYTIQSEITKMNKGGFCVNFSLEPPNEGKCVLFLFLKSYGKLLCGAGNKYFKQKSLSLLQGTRITVLLNYQSLKMWIDFIEYTFYLCHLSAFCAVCFRVFQYEIL